MSAEGENASRNGHLLSQAGELNALQASCICSTADGTRAELGDMGHLFTLGLLPSTTWANSLGNLDRVFLGPQFKIQTRG